MACLKTPIYTVGQGLDGAMGQRFEDEIWERVLIVEMDSEIEALVMIRGGGRPAA